MGATGRGSGRIGGRSRPVELLGVVAFNLVPLVGVVVWNWSLGVVVVLYWLENAVVGALNIPKVVLAARGNDLLDGLGLEAYLGEWAGVVSYGGAVASAGFFALHYGVFWLFHGAFVVVVFLDGLDHLVALGPTVLAGLLGLTVSRSIEFYREFYREREYLVRKPREQASRPYRRVVVLHVAIVGGGLVIEAFGEPVGALALLVILKIGHDVAALLADRGRRERGRVGWIRP